MKINCLSGFRAAVFGLIICCRFTILKIFSKILRFFLPAALIFAELPNVMNANEFLPPTVRLSQAFDLEKFSGGASGSKITRRSFLKRTGGATVATLVAWNLASKIEAMSMINDASADPEDWGSRILICYQDPRESNALAYVNKTVNDVAYQYSSADMKAWRKVPQVDISDGMSTVNSSGTILDAWGQGITYTLLHWLEYLDIVQRGNYVNAENESAKLISKIRSWAAIVEGRWLFKKVAEDSGVPDSSYDKKTFNRTTGVTEYWKRDQVKHRVMLLASSELGGIVRPLSPDPIVDVQNAGNETVPWHQLEFNKWLHHPEIPSPAPQLELVGWLQLSNYFSKTNDIALGGQKFISAAAFIPKATLEGTTQTVGSSSSVSFEIAKGIGISGESGISSSLQKTYKVATAPKMLTHSLVWGHKTRTITNSPPVTVLPSSPISIPNPVNYLSSLGVSNDQIKAAIDTGCWEL